METQRNLLRRTIRPQAVGIALSATFVLAALVELGAYEVGVRAEVRATAHRDLPANYCVSCHSDPTMVRMMLYKDDNNGTAAYCAGVQLPPQKERGVFPASGAAAYWKASSRSHQKGAPVPAYSDGAQPGASWPGASK